MALRCLQSLLAAYHQLFRSIPSAWQQFSNKLRLPMGTLTGDFNAHHSWESKKPTGRGKTPVDLAACYGLAVVNDRNPISFRGVKVNNSLDFTMITSSISQCVSWSMDIGTHRSDHLSTSLRLVASLALKFPLESI